jgi:LysR family transcriptional regulator (chromosome initiation inhibitor)
MTLDRSDDLQDAFVRGLRRGAGGASTLRHAVPTSEGFVTSIVAGLGWGMVPEAQAAAPLRAGRLLSLAPRRPLDVPLYWQQWRLDSPALAAVADAVTATATEALHPPPAS